MPILAYCTKVTKSELNHHKQINIVHKSISSVFMKHFLMSTIAFFFFSILSNGTLYW
jgi:hypothetical protein